ncbi:MAG TPA: hypothetical protein VEY69_15690 [Lautropia sp.]|nr:hypothetical protein [Lautropia sp.]
MIEPVDDLARLTARAKDLGIPTNSGIYKSKAEGWNEMDITPEELHRRIREEERHLREGELHRLAVESNKNAKDAIKVGWWAAVASALSAGVALIALIYSLTPGS